MYRSCSSSCIIVARSTLRSDVQHGTNNVDTATASVTCNMELLSLGSKSVSMLQEHVADLVFRCAVRQLSLRTLQVMESNTALLLVLMLGVRWCTANDCVLL